MNAFNIIQRRLPKNPLLHIKGCNLSGKYCFNQCRLQKTMIR
ncbi:hypothetical protein SynNOUM97013_01494 [Synechococcus sp. NOUM97013]|nr:hypothetical protein SynNOUM97013_01494 [Synechococcus sp. NOUM97013]